jgi:lipopolysaccharide heptosyltransferase II
MPSEQRTGLTILQVLSWLNYGGVESYVIRLSRALTGRGHRLIVASGGGLLEPELKAAGIEHVHIDFTGGRTVAGARALRRLIEGEQVDVVNAHNWRAGLVTCLAARRAGVPWLFTVHGTRSASHRFGVFYWSKLVAVVSEASRRNLVEDFHVPPERVVNTIIGVDCERFRPTPPDARLEAELGLAPGARRVVHVSRFSHSKAPVAMALIEAAATLSRAVPEVEVALVGQGPRERAVARAAAAVNARLGRRAVIALGGRGDVPALLSLATVVVATASVALEAMASGRPLVAAGKGGYFGVVTPENIGLADESCFADHRPKKPLAAGNLAADLARLLIDAAEASRLGAQGREIAESRYATPVLAREMEALYQRVLCDRAKVKRIAVLHLNQIGDLIFTLPALKALREGFPEAHITSVVRPHLAGLVRLSGFVDAVTSRNTRGAIGPFRFGLQLRRERADLAVALSQSASMALAAWLSAAPERIGYIDSDLYWLLNRRVQERGIPCPAKVLHLVRCLGLAPGKTDYVGLVCLSPEDQQAGEEMLRTSALDGAGPLIALAPGESTDRPYKSWSAEGFAGVAAGLAERHNARLLVVGGKRDQALGDEILGGLERRAANLAGRTSPSELAAVLSHCDLLIGIDSGPMHVAAAMGRPVVGLFGPTNPYRTGPQGEGHQLIFHRQPCWPCMTPTCSDRPCMGAITVEEVLAAAERGLASAALRGPHAAAVESDASSAKGRS